MEGAELDGQGLDAVGRDAVEGVITAEVVDGEAHHGQAVGGDPGRAHFVVGAEREGRQRDAVPDGRIDQTGDVGVSDDDQAVLRDRGGLGEGPVHVEVEQAVGAADELEGPEPAGAGVGADDGQAIAGDGPGIGVARLA